MTNAAPEREGGDAALEPREIHAPEGARLLEVVWADGQSSLYEHRALRGLCPCAHCQGHSGPIEWVEATSTLPDDALALTDLRTVGSYAISLTWGDGHSTGIYTFPYLRELGALYGKGLEALEAARFSR